MDNFNKRPNHSMRRRNMDGFMTRDSFRGTGSIGFDKVAKKLPEPLARPEPAAKPIDDMRRPEGFHPAAQPQIANAAAPAIPAPLLNTGGRRGSRLGHKTRRRFGRRRLSTGIKKPSKTWWRRTKRVIYAFGGLILIVGLYFVLKIYFLQRNVFKGGGNAPALAQTVDVAKLNGEGDGRVNVLLLGIGGPGHDGPDLSDTIVLMSIDPVNKTASMLSIPRDLWVKIPSNGSQKINAAFAYGKQQSKGKSEDDKTRDGLKKINETISPVLGVPIHYHAVVNFAAFQKAVDAVGGITFDVPEQLYDPTVAWENNYNSVIAPKGMQTFDGKRALLYARSRETSSDFARGERQRQLMVALKEKILSLGTFSNPLKISQLLDSFGDNVYTDFSTGDLSRLYQIASEIPSASIISLDLVTPPHNLVTTSPINGLSTVVPRAGLYNYDDINNYVRNALRDGFLQKENAEVMVLNGTTVDGLAGAKTKELKSFGYNVTVTDSAPSQDYAKTVIVDVTQDSKYTKNYLEKRFKVTATATLPAGITAGTADFVIILGSDQQTTSQN